MSVAIATHRTPPRRLLQAEFLKVRSTRVIWALLGGTLALALLALVGVLAGDQDGLPAPNTAEGTRRIFVSAGAGGIFALALGILASAGEERHGTLTQAFLAVPARTPVLVAKIVTGALVGLAFGIVSCVFCTAVALPWTASQGEAISLSSGELWTVLGGVTLSTALYGALGAGLGELIGRQVPALLVSLGWFVVAESAIVAALPDVGKWLPGGASGALTRSPDADDLLPMGWGGLLMLGYVVVFAAVGVIVARRREVGA
jgi:ABC-2 type transport system permease protein